tara:strand:- start:1010 stop:1264 length:255 start_codon:yes stop_codon:yes gene_type:complete
MHPHITYTILIAIVCLVSALGAEPYLLKWSKMQGSRWSSTCSTLHKMSWGVLFAGLALIVVLGVFQLSVNIVDIVTREVSNVAY